VTPWVTGAILKAGGDIVREIFEQLSAQKQIAAEAVASGLRAGEIAIKLGISAQVIYGWLREPLFQQAVNELLAESRRHTVLRIASLSEIALRAIEECLSDPSVSPSVRIPAAFKLLEIVFGKNLSLLPQSQEGGGRGGLSEEKAAEIRAKFLGIAAEDRATE